jgi:hypothetical protein
MIGRMRTFRRLIGKAETPLDLEFSVVAQRRPFDLVARNFTSLQERFDSARGLREYAQLGIAPEKNPGQADRRHGTLSISGDEPFFTLFRSETSQRAPYSSVIVDVQSFAGTGGEQDAVFAGLVKDESNYVVAWFSHVSGAAGIDTVVDGELTTLVAVDTPIDAPCRAAFSLTGNTVAALLDPGDGFRPLVHARVPDDLDLRRPAALDDYRNAFGARASSGTIVLDAAEAGYFGQTGLRDPHVVTYADGAPYIKYGKVFLTMTQAGLGFFETAHCGVWMLDLADHRLEQVAHLFFQRGDTDAVYGDHACHLVRDEQNDRWVVATSTWGDFTGDGVEVHYATVPTSTDLLHDVHVLRTEPLPLPVAELTTPTAGQWDPHLVRIRDRWYVGFVNAREFFDFYPALACSQAGADFTELSLVAADTTKNETEGFVIQRMGGTWYVFASNGDKSAPHMRDQFPVYDLSLRQLGALNAPHPTNIPWPMVFPVPQSGGRTRWLMVTFEGTSYHRDMLGYGTHGDVLVLEAKPVTRGHEFPTD